MKRDIIAIFIFLVIIITLWQVYESGVNRAMIESGRTGIEAFIPTPLTIASTFRDQGGQIFSEALYTLRRALMGFFIGAVFAMIMAFVFLLMPAVRKVAFPISFIVNSFPIVGFAPVIILAFGQGSWLSIVFISALICYFPVLISMDTALRQTDQELLDLLRVMNATPMQTFTKLRFPLALPHLFLSMKLAVPASIIGATMGEWLGTRNGIGQIITIALYQLKPGLLYASLITITMISLVLIYVVSKIESKIILWKRAGR